MSQEQQEPSARQKETPTRKVFWSINSWTFSWGLAHPVHEAKH